jgi:4-amino-4-deoxy-L-arabinose transferase-like glycosyltransferase
LPSVRRYLSLALVVSLTALLYLPSLTREELDDEEGRRAIPAREMMASRDWILPTVFGRPYLAKPPLGYWTIAAAASLSGSVDERSTRLPSACATGLTAVILLFLGRAMAGERAGLCAALCFLVTFGTFEKGADGELEAQLALWTTAALACLWAARSRALGFELAGALALALALLVKGPSALVYFGAFAIGIASVRGRAWLGSRPFLLVLGAGSTVAAAWIFLLAAHDGAPDLWSTWSHELGGNEGGLLGWLGDRLDLVTGVPVMLLPGALVILCALRSEVGSRLFQEQAMRALCVCVALSLAVFLVWPGARVRYLYPLAPLACLVVGRLLDLGLAAGAKGVFAARLRLVLAVLAGVGVLALVASLVLAVRPIGALERFSPLGNLCASAACAAGLDLLRRLRRAPSAALLGFALALLCALRLVERLEVVPARASRHGRVADARALSEALPLGATLHTALWAEFNVLFYVDRPVRYAADPRGLGSGAFVLVAAGDTLPGERILARTLGQGRAVEIVRSAGSSR